MVGSSASAIVGVSGFREVNPHPSCPNDAIADLVARLHDHEHRGLFYISRGLLHESVVDVRVEDLTGFAVLHDFKLAEGFKEPVDVLFVRAGDITGFASQLHFVKHGHERFDRVLQTGCASSLLIAFRTATVGRVFGVEPLQVVKVALGFVRFRLRFGIFDTCLLYTSDAADDIALV